MRNKIIFNLFFALSLMAALFAQSAHSIAHYEESLTQKHCHHQSSAKANITHQHASLDHCSVCDFTFAAFTSPVAITFPVPTAVFQNLHPFEARQEIVSHFRGSLFALRAPPTLMA
ncbi:MAG: hypothetical protein EOO88_48310 [Pedobacter sp.]|nr:MAG: hypothetical protein EOO88_48310 [Pedobacter sp.]